MARGVGGKRPICVSIGRNGKSIRFSTAASEVLDAWDAVDLFEKNGVFAVRSAPRGRYHISKEQGRRRVLLSNQALVAYLCATYSCAPGATLPAWMGEEDGVLFFGGMQHNAPRQPTLDQAFTPLILEYNQRAGLWAYVHDNWIEFSKDIRTNLPPALTPALCGNTVALLHAPHGPLIPVPRRQQGNPMLVSKPLADFLRSQFRGHTKGLRLHAALLPNGLLLAETLTDLDRPNLDRLRPVVLSDAQSFYLSFGRPGCLYLSARARKAIGDNTPLSLCSSGHLFALRPDPAGPIKPSINGYAAQIFSRSLEKCLRARWPAAKRLFLSHYKGIWILSDSTASPIQDNQKTYFRNLLFSAASGKKQMPLPFQTAHGGSQDAQRA